MSNEWGLCKDCKWWQLEPRAGIKATTVGQCIDEDLQRFTLRVSGNSGCNRFAPGRPGEPKGPAGGRRPQSRHGKSPRCDSSSVFYGGSGFSGEFSSDRLGDAGRWSVAETLRQRRLVNAVALAGDANSAS